MINSGVLTFSAGRIRTRNGIAPDNFNGGTPTITIAGPVNLLAACAVVLNVDRKIEVDVEKVEKKK